MVGAYTDVPATARPHASSTVRVVQQLGGSFETAALLAPRPPSRVRLDDGFRGTGVRGERAVSRPKGPCAEGSCTQSPRVNSPRLPVARARPRETR